MMALHDNIKSRTFCVWAQARREWPQLVDQNRPLPLVTFKTRGTVAGRAYYMSHRVDFNAALAEHVGLEEFQQTIVHEVAHLVSVYVYGAAGRGHGACWRSVMTRLGVDPKRCHQYDVSTVRVRNVQRHPAVCQCEGYTHQLAAVQRNKILKGTNYQCRKCRSILRLLGPDGQPMRVVAVPPVYRDRLGLELRSMFGGAV